MKQREDLTGKHYGRLLVVELHHVDDWHHSHWKCICDPEKGGCGKPMISRENRLKRFRTVSCGCWRADPAVRRAARLKMPVKRRKQIARMGGKARKLKARTKK